MFGKLAQRFRVREESIGRFLIASMALGFAALVAAGIAVAVSTARNQEHTRRVNHTYEVELAIEKASIVIEQAETTRRGYLITGEAIYLSAYRSAASKLPEALRSIARLTADNPRQQANIARLQSLTDALKAQRDTTVALTIAGRKAEATALFVGEASARRMRNIRDLATAMGDEERRLLALRDAEQRRSVQYFYTTLIVAGILLLVVAIASLLTVLRYTRDLGKSRDALRDFADSLEDLVKARTADLSRANEEIQRFAYIVSHDLRAPLVNVMGFTAELDAATVALTELIERAEQVAPDIVTEEARLAAREDLPESIRFIRTSTQKMDRLINAILKLSREGRRTITPERLDMTSIVDTIQASLQHLLDDRGIAFHIAAPLPPITSDRLAIEQILSNLIENAIKYLQPGRPGIITVRGTREAARAVFEVEDNGRGIAASDHQRVFDLFRRSGNQDQPGEGIGLAHVRALAYRLGGVIDVRSELGNGATFRLTLPTKLTEPEEPKS